MCRVTLGLVAGACGLVGGVYFFVKIFVALLLTNYDSGPVARIHITAFGVHCSGLNSDLGS